MNRLWDATQCRKLFLSGLGLETVPEYVCDLPLRTAITEMNLLQNKITRLPPDLGLLTNLRQLRFDESLITFPSQVIAGIRYPAASNPKMVRALPCLLSQVMSLCPRGACSGRL